MSNISISELGDAVGKMLEEYKDYATDEVKAAAQEAAKTAMDQLRKTAPVRSGTYARSWKTKVTKETSSGIHVTVYSPTRYRLTHLLEHGHAKRGGGRVAAKPHIAAAQEKAEQVFEETLTKALEVS